MPEPRSANFCPSRTGIVAFAHAEVVNGASVHMQFRRDARRETDNADALRINAPLLGFAAHEPDGPLSVLKRTPGRFALGFTRAARHPILEDNAGHANGVEPVGDLLAFQLPVEIPIAS